MKLNIRQFKMPSGRNLKAKWHREQNDFLKRKAEWWAVIRAEQQLIRSFNHLLQTSSDALSELKPLIQKAENFSHRARKKLK